MDIDMNALRALERDKDIPLTVLVDALEEAAGAVAGAAASLAEALDAHDLLSVELSGEHAPADWVDDGRLGALIALPATLLCKALLIDTDPRMQWLNSFIASHPERGNQMEQAGDDVPGRA